MEQFPTSGRYWRLFVEQEVNSAWIPKCCPVDCMRRSADTLTVCAVAGTVAGLCSRVQVCVGVHAARERRGLSEAWCAVVSVVARPI